jgi:threonine/homoserine/homoserine lactone efflux protein
MMSIGLLLRSLTGMDVQLLGFALILGATSAISPGPLLALVVSTTLHRGFLAGLRIAVAPLLTDAPILGIGLLTLHALPAAALGGIGLAGGLFLVGLGIEQALKARHALLPSLAMPAVGGEHELLQGVVVNLLNPSPWLFVLTVMAPLLAVTWPRNPASAVGFVVVFYLLLVGGKIALAAALTILRSHFRPRLYRGALLLAALLLCAVGAGLAWRGWLSLTGA